MRVRFTMAVPVAMLGLLALASPARAQRGIGVKPAPAGRMSPSGSWGRGGGFRPAHPLRPYFRGRGNRYGSGWGWAYLPFLGDYDYPGYDYYGYGYGGYDPAMTEEARRESPPQPALAAPPPRDIQPVLIERQGDRWVQVAGYSESPATQPEAEAGEITHPRAATPSGNEAAGPPRELPTAVLVFRDGHQEEVKSYTIIGDTLYAKADFWTDGSWTKRIEIANLDVPATLKLNRERGSRFRLPSGPQEVMIRP